MIKLDNYRELKQVEKLAEHTMQSAERSRRKKNGAGGYKKMIKDGFFSQACFLKSILAFLKAFRK